MKKLINKKVIIYSILVVLSIGSIIFQTKLKKSKEYTNNTQEKYVIHVVGEVKQEGVYTFSNFPRMQDAINAAGGFTSSADVNSINLAKKIKDGEKIIIPELKKNVSSENTDIKENGKLNLSTATKEELMELDGVGEATANKILDYIKENGISDIEELKNIDGIGESKFLKIKEMIDIY